MNNSKIEQPLTVKQAAELLQVSEKTVYRLIFRGILKRVPEIRHIRIPRESVQKLLGG